MTRARALQLSTLILLLFTAFAAAQNGPQSVGNLLGAHDVGGHGCLGCHTGQRSTMMGAAAGEFGESRDSSAEPAWGPSTIPLYGKTIAFGEGGRYVEVFPKNITTHNREVDGILICLSCHDGNLEPPTMMTGQSFEQRIGMLPAPGYGGSPIPTLLGSDNGDYQNDHPVGTAAVIPTGDGLAWINNGFSVVPGSPYAQFVAHYGRPSLAPGSHNNPWGVNSSGQPFVLCTTCHNQHVMSMYASSAQSQIAGDGGGKLYPTYFFLNGPYGTKAMSAANPSASASTQFCRQCHFTTANEANNANTVATVLQSF